MLHRQTSALTTQWFVYVKSLETLKPSFSAHTGIVPWRQNVWGARLPAVYHPVPGLKPRVKKSGPTAVLSNSHITSLFKGIHPMCP